MPNVIPKNAAPSIVELHWENRGGKVKIVPPDRDIMVLPIEAAIQACRAYGQQIQFNFQFSQLLDRLAQWMESRRDSIQDAYLTCRDAGLLFLVVQKGRKCDEELEEELTGLDLEIANDSDYGLIRLDVLTLPSVSEAAVGSFLAPGATFKYKATS